MLNVTYNYYYHLNEAFPKERIAKLIKDKKYNDFMKEYKKWGQLYLPSHAHAYADEDYEHMVSVDITEEWNFNEITFSEYECG